MRLALLSLFFGTLGMSGLAYAQAEAIDEVPPEVPPGAYAPVPAPPPAYAAPPAQRPQAQRRVYGTYPARPVYPPPAARPSYPNRYQPGGYYSYPAYPTYPAYPGPGAAYPPPPDYGYPRLGYSVPPYQYVRPAHQGPLSCQLCRKPERRGPILGLGVRYSALGVRQQINGRNVSLKGWGAVLRLRGRKHLAFELSLDFLGGNFPAVAQPQASGGGGSPPSSGGANPDGSTTNNPGPSQDGPSFHVGDVGRQSRVISASLMAYLLRNTRSRIFNLYFLAGGGYISSTLGLTNQYGRRVRQNFGEYEGHVGAGAELKFRWFAIGMLRNNRSAPAAYYGNAEGAPVNPRSFGYQGTISALLWF